MFWFLQTATPSSVMLTRRRAKPTIELDPNEAIDGN